MNLAVLGQPCVDEIIRPGEDTVRSVGGILYSLAALDRAISEYSPMSTFAALLWHSTPDLTLLDPFYSRLSNLNRTTGLWATDELTNRVQLVYSNASDRTEHCPTILPALTQRELEHLDYSKLDGLFVNMISGFDINLTTMKWLASQVRHNRPHLHLDVHALSLGELSFGDQAVTGSDFGIGRKVGPIEGWREWISSAHSVQLNELEARHIAGPEHQGESAFLREAKRHVRSSAAPTEVIVITRAERGATLYFMQSDEEVTVSAPTVLPIDTTGSGDVFGSVFLLVFLLTRSYAQALTLAVRWASWNTELRSIYQLIDSDLPDQLLEQGLIIS